MTWQQELEAISRIGPLILIVCGVAAACGFLVGLGRVLRPHLVRVAQRHAEMSAPAGKLRPLRIEDASAGRTRNEPMVLLVETAGDTREIVLRIEIGTKQKVSMVR